MIRESAIEKYLVAQVKKRGGRAYKWVSPGNRGVPDRIVCFPQNRIYFVELKALYGELSAQQIVQIQQLRDLDCRALVIRTKPDVDAFVAACGVEI